MRLLFISLLTFISAAAATAFAQPAAADLEREKAAIVQTALDYADGYYGGEPARMTRAVSPYLSKRGLLAIGSTPPVLIQMNADTLIEASYGLKLAPVERRITTEVLDINGEVASARVFSAEFNDYLHLVKRAGAWQILNVLWHRPPASPPPSGDGREAVAQAVRDYAAAMYAADAERVQRLLHPLAHLRVMNPAQQGRPRIVREQNAETVAAALATGQVKLGGKLEDTEVTVYGVDVEIASARMMLGGMPAYLHLARQDGRWRIVNALLYPPAPPSSPTAAR